MSCCDVRDGLALHPSFERALWARDQASGQGQLRGGRAVDGGEWCCSADQDRTSHERIADRCDKGGSLFPESMCAGRRYRA